MDSYIPIGDTPDTEIPKVPGVEALQRDAILKSMLANISSYEKSFPRVKVDVLKDKVLEKVLIAPETNNDVNFNPELQLRGFLQTFEDLPAYAEQFRVLDDRTKEQISTFKDNAENWKNTEIWKDTKEHGFLLPNINPDVSHVLVTSPSVSSRSFLSRVETWLLGTFVSVAKPLALLFVKCKLGWAVRMLRKAQVTKYAGGPAIYEDKVNTKLVDVSLRQGPCTSI